MARVWAERGNVEQTKHFLEEAVKQPNTTREQDGALDYLLIAHLKK